MISSIERQDDILKMISRLDISPTLYKNAVEKYQALAAFLEDCGIEADIYPQGSFAFGTVVRPSAKDSDANYDLDFICQLHLNRNDIAPSVLRQRIEDALKSNDRYGGKLTKCGECFAIEYADINGVGFSIDIVPAVDEGLKEKLELMQLSSMSNLIMTSIAIPRQNGERNYNWITNNPRGFKCWFDDINKPYLECGRTARRAAIFECNRTVFNSVDDIPSDLERSAMQRVIQLMKYHRDIYYQNLRRTDKDEIKPISAIINTLVASIAKSAHPTSDVFSLLDYVLSELKIYALQQTMHFDEFQRVYAQRNVLTRRDGKWLLLNPANPKDNLADKWNSNPIIPEFFFKWITACYKDFIESMRLSDDQFRVAMTNAFGSETIQRNWGTKYSDATPKPINASTASKPYLSL